MTLTNDARAYDGVDEVEAGSADATATALFLWELKHIILLRHRIISILVKCFGGVSYY